MSALPVCTAPVTVGVGRRTGVERLRGGKKRLVLNKAAEVMRRTKRSCGERRGGGEWPHNNGITADRTDRKEMREAI